jgi:hypothetical protein
VFPARYELNSYIVFRKRLVSKRLSKKTNKGKWEFELLLCVMEHLECNGITFHSVKRADITRNAKHVIRVFVIQSCLWTDVTSHFAGSQHLFIQC